MRVKDICMSCMQEKGNVKICPHCGWNENTPAVSPLHLPPGTILLDRYLIGKALGQGCCGITYIGLDILRAEVLAIKEYFPAELASRDPATAAVTPHDPPEARQAFREGFRRFIEEGEALTAFWGEAGIVPVRGCAEANETAYLVMIFIKGRTLFDYLTNPPQLLSFNDIIKMMVPILGALSRLHRSGLLHRDVSPENIMITDDGRAWLIDFGSARLTVAEKCHNQGEVLKSGFAPCEQHYSLAAQGSWTDVYGAAATIYFAISGQAPPESLARVHKDSIIAPSRLGIDIPDYAEAALLKALAVRANERYHRIAEFANDLRRPRPVEGESIELAETPAAESPSAEAPAADAPSPDAPSPDAPSADAPSADAPAAGTPAWHARAAQGEAPPEFAREGEPSLPVDRLPQSAAASWEWLFNRRTLIILLVLLVLGLIIGIAASVYKAYLDPAAISGAVDWLVWQRLAGF